MSDRAQWASPRSHDQESPSASTDRDPVADVLAARRAERGPLRLVDWFIPTSTRFPTLVALRRARLTVSVSFITGCAVLATVVAAADPPDSKLIRAASTALGVLLVAAPVGVRAQLPIHWVGHGLVALMASYAVMLAGVTGGTDTGGFFLAMLLPLPAVLLLGPRSGAAWAIVSALGMAALSVAFDSGLERLVTPEQAEVARWSFWGCIAGITGTAAVATTYEALQARTLERLIEAKRHADREHERRLELESEFRVRLERLVEERTSELSTSREQLRHADRLASIGTLAAGVAHQINNPIGSILLGAELALEVGGEAEGDDRYREALAQNVVDAKRCGEIVRNLLRFARAGSEHRTPVELDDLVSQALDTLRFPNRTITFDGSTDALPLTANPVELEQVVLNLITNAIEAGAQNVSVSTELAHGEARLEISDDGRGIRSEDRIRLFDPFFTTRTHEGGTGLGLSVVHRIVEDHAGRIEVESQPDEGTRFLVTLPLGRQSPMIDPPCDSSSKTPISSIPTASISSASAPS